jgi:hypothetical protein
MCAQVRRTHAYSLRRRLTKKLTQFCPIVMTSVTEHANEEIGRALILNFYVLVKKADATED